MKAPRRRSAALWLMAAAALAHVACQGHPPSPARPVVRHLSPVRMPARPIVPDDFRTPVDRSVGDTTRAAFENVVYAYLENALLRPVHDDVISQQVAVDGVEIQPGQFADRPDLERVVTDCAKVLGIPRPRVYVMSEADGAAYTTRFTDPVIVVSARLLRRYDDAAELRFIVGHEMGHIKASHLRLKLLIDQLARTLSRSPIIPDDLAVLPLLPALKWAREAEMSADNAGLLCAQELGAAERALMRLLLNLDEETIGAVNVDKYLAQKEGLGLSGLSEAWFHLRQLSRAHPFVPDRIRQLREYRRERYGAVLRG